MYEKSHLFSTVPTVVLYKTTRIVLLCTIFWWCVCTTRSREKLAGEKRPRFPIFFSRFLSRYSK